MKISTFLVSLIVVCFTFLFNPSNLKFDYGNGGGRYDDRIDSASEYNVRNSVSRNILFPNDSSLLLMVVDGTKNENYVYDNTLGSKYFSNLGFQQNLFTLLASNLKINSSMLLDRFFINLRFVSCILLASFSIIYISKILSLFNIHYTLLPAILIAANLAFMLYSQNLYFISFIFFIGPLLYLRYIDKYPNIVLYCASILFFLRGYEFATIYAIFVLFSVYCFESGEQFERFIKAIKGFSTVCIAFITAFNLHILIVYYDCQLNDFLDAFNYVTGNIANRVMSLNNVPIPFSREFFDRFVYLLSTPAFGIVRGFSISKIQVICILLIAMIIDLKSKRYELMPVYLYGFLGYISWYIFGYQHIMSHSVMYDWYAFGFSYGISFIIVVSYFISKKFNFKS